MQVNTHQEILLGHLQSIFPNAPIHTNSRDSNCPIILPGTGTLLELDAWIPSLQLCFEFQDSYHYVTTWYTQRSIHNIKQGDIIKQSLVHNHGFTLVVVPCWWDGNFESLAATISFQRPDLQLTFDNTESINLNPSPSFFDFTHVPEIGELMLASFPRASSAVLISDSHPWWMGEKYDGIRCCWHVERRTMFTRYGRELVVLPSILSHMPSIFTDSELWFGRGQFSHTYNLVSGSLSQILWHELKLVSFDIPSYDFKTNVFEERFEHLLEKISPTNPFNIVVSRVKSTKQSQLDKYLQFIIEDLGEGTILRLPQSFYEHGRSSALLKLKASQGDREGIVIGRDESGIKLKLPDGVTFSVPAESVHVSGRLQIGDVVTFAYESNARRGVPIGPKICRVRSDLSWSDVVLQDLSDSKSHKKEGFTTQPQRHWTDKTMRMFFESYAKKKRKMDPLLAETWYNISYQEILQEKGGISILHRFGGYFNILQRLFPELKLNRNDFYTYRKQWKDIDKRREFFENYAKEHKFNPLNPDNWYVQPRSQIEDAKGARGVLMHHKGSVRHALASLFPNIGIDKTKFHFQLYAVSSRRKFFEDFAKEKGFDPLIAKNWYLQAQDQILSLKRAAKVLSYHQNSVTKALSDLFPDIGLDRSKFRFHSLWNDTRNRKKFFLDYAKENQFDPLVPDNWYIQPRDKINTFRGASGVMYYYNDSIAQALISLLPNIGLDKNKFQFNMWRDKQNRRKFFENYATINGFSPLVAENWYMEPKDKITSKKGASGVLYYHNRSISRALIDLFPEVSFNVSNFHYSYVWRDAEKRKNFFITYSKVHAFDFKDPECWYSVSRDDILSVKGSMGVLFHHNNSLTTALMDLFPDIHFVLSRFITATTPVDIEYRRKFFESYAHDNGFDPLIADNWYHQQRAKIMAYKNASKVMPHYQGAVSKALTHLFPNIGFEQSKFSFRRKQ